MAGQGAGLIDRAGRREPVHQLGAPAESADRHAAANHLAEHGQVRAQAVALLGAAGTDPEAGHHLVEDEQRAVPVAQRAQGLQESGLRQDAAHVAGDGLDDRGGELPAARGEAGLDIGGVVVAGDLGVGGRARGHAGRGGHAAGQGAGAGRDQQRIDMSVVAAGELEDAVAAGGGTR